MHFLKDTFTPQHQLAEKKRIEWIDLAKGICIFLVLANHVYYYQCVFLEQLRMPLYFVLSGLFFKDYGSLKEFAVKKTNKILIPFVFFYVCSQIFCWAMRWVMGLPDKSLYPDFLVLFTQEYWFNNPLWFLLCLYEINILYYIIQRYVQSQKLRLMTIIVAGVTGAVFSYTHIKMPLYLGAMLTALPFYYLGTVLKKSFVLLYNERRLLQALLGILGVIILTLLPSYIPTSVIKFVVNDIEGSYLVAVMSSSVAVISLLLVCKWVKWLPFFSFIGRYSIIVLCVHFVYISILNHISIIVNASHGRLYELIIVSVMSWITIPLAIKFIPWFVAQKDLIRVKS